MVRRVLHLHRRSDRPGHGGFLNWRRRPVAASQSESVEPESELFWNLRTRYMEGHAKADVDLWSEVGTVLSDVLSAGGRLQLQPKQVLR